MSTQYTFEAIGTHWQIDIQDTISKEQSDNLRTQIMERIALFDAHYSRFRPDSLVSEIARTPGSYQLPSDAEPMLSLYHTLYRITHGAFTPLIGQALSDAGYDARYSLQEKKLQAPPPWDEALVYNYPTLITKLPVLIDVGAAGKGYLIDIVSELIENAGIQNYTVDAGGDMRHRATRSEPLTVGLENPANTSQAIGIAHIRNQSLCGSAGNRRAWGNFHHILDPHSLTSPTHIAALWTIADTTLLADALSTCLFFVPPATLLKHHTFEYLILQSDLTVTMSPSFPAQLFTT